MTRLRALSPLFLFGALIGLLITAVVTWLQRGLAPGFLDHWWRAAALSIAVMLPSGALLMAGIAAAVRRLMAGRPEWLQRAAMALGMGAAMEAVASALSTVVNLGTQDFLAHWLQAYWTAAPLILLVGPFMVLVVKPWAERRLARVEGRAAGGLA